MMNTCGRLIFQYEPTKVTNAPLSSKKLRSRSRLIGIAEDAPSTQLFEPFYKSCFSDNSIIFPGSKKEDGLVGTLLTSDIFLHVSHIDYSPNNVYEAMMITIPEICNNVGESPSIVSNKHYGILLLDNSPDLWTETICELISNPEEMSRLGKNARNSALFRHSKQHIIKSVYDTYQDIIHMETFSGKDFVL